MKTISGRVGLHERPGVPMHAAMDNLVPWSCSTKDAIVMFAGECLQALDFLTHDHGAWAPPQAMKSPTA
ncbi:MAG: hypothetical protein ACU841_04395 [Gammaproteobacteria bacterium]